MKIRFLVPALLAGAVFASGCASLAPPERPAYTGPDNISSAQSEQLVGVWLVTDLNPYPNSEQQSTVIEYRSDGSVSGLMELKGEQYESLAAFGDMQFEMSGQWTLEGDTVTHKDIKMKSTKEGGLSTMMANMVNSQEGISGKANIYELSADRIVMMGSDGAAMEYIRQ